jgi:quercetin dioxygenase-like cupin family protein
VRIGVVSKVHLLLSNSELASGEGRKCRHQARRRTVAKAGDEIVNPVTGHRNIFRKTAQDTDGKLLQVDWIGRPGWKAGPRHVHPYQEERFKVVSGTLGSHVEGVERIHRAGEEAVVPAEAKHTVWNAGDEEVHALVEFRPALRSETVLETLFGLAQDGKTNKAGVPSNPLQLSLIVHEYEDEIYLAQPPLAVQRVLFGALAFIGRLFGYRADYPYPYSRPGQERLLRSEGERASAVSRMMPVGVVVAIVLVVLVLLLLFLSRRSR